jgi:hypothetical protein
MAGWTGLKGSSFFFSDMLGCGDPHLQIELAAGEMQAMALARY